MGSNRRETISADASVGFQQQLAVNLPIQPPRRLAASFRQYVRMTDTTSRQAMAVLEAELKKTDAGLIPRARAGSCSTRLAADRRCLVANGSVHADSPTDAGIP
jgi:hypothetical protein